MTNEGPLRNGINEHRQRLASRAKVMFRGTPDCTMISKKIGLAAGNPMGGDDKSFDVFFSYHWRDHTPVELVARTLTERGFSVFLDRWYLTPGQPWPQALERTLASCNSVAVFLGADGLGPWQQRETDLALDRQGREPGLPVIPVLLTPAQLFPVMA